jgi:hypothetical protein
MAQRRFHYEQAFEHYLRANGIAYVAVDEAKRALHGKTGIPGAKKLKNFDFVVYAESGRNLLVDVKGRKHADWGTKPKPTPVPTGNIFTDSTKAPGSGAKTSGGGGRALQNWVTRDDIACLQTWSGIFGEDFEPVFAFLFWCEDQPPDALFLEVFEYNRRWYAVLAVRLSDYVTHMRPRSAKWDTVSLPAAAFEEHRQPLKALL